MITERGEEEGGREARSNPSKVPTRRAWEGGILMRWVSSPPPPPLPFFSLRALSLGFPLQAQAGAVTRAGRQRGCCALGRMPSPGGCPAALGAPGLRHLCAHTPRTAPLRRLPGSDPRPLLSFSPLSGQILIMVVRP